MADIATMNLPQLRALARDLGIPNRSKMRKGELLTALIEAQSAVLPSSLSKCPATPLIEAAAESSAAPSSHIESAAPQDFGPNGDPGLPLPEHYGRDMVMLMVQDPEHLYVWWELSGNGLAQLNASIGGGASALVIDGPNGREQRDVDFAAGNYYLTVSPTSSYSVSLALRDSTGALHILVSSRAVATPAIAASDRRDEEWMAVDETFSELLSRANLSEGEHIDQLSSAERLRQQSTKSWSQAPVPTWFSGDIMGAPSSTAFSSTLLSGTQLGPKSSP